MRKYAKLIAIAGLVLAVSSTASALSLGGYSGPILIQYINYDMGASYAPGTYADGIAACNAAQVGSVTGGYTIPAGYKYAGQDEDAWAIFKVTNITTDDATPQTLWVDGQDGEEIVGMLYGLVDVGVNSTFGVTISDGYYLDMYVQPDGIYSELADGGTGVMGSGGRIAFDKYEGVGYDAAGNAIAGSSLLLHAETVPGSLDFSTGFFSGATVSHTVSIVDSQAFLNASAGSWFDTGHLVTGRTWTEVSASVPPNSVVADAYLVSGVVDYDTSEGGDWDYKSTDPVRMNYSAIPEPMTMFAVAMAIGGLGRYVRRR